MSEQFSFLGNKCKAAIAAISLGVLLLLPASLGYGGTIVEQAFGQLELIPPNGEPEVGAGAGGGGEEQEQPTLPAGTSTLLLRGIIGSSLTAPGGGGGGPVPPGAGPPPRPGNRRRRARTAGSAVRGGPRPP